MQRHCFIVGPTKIIGASAIIGDSCSGFPIWSVPCEGTTLTDQTCGATDIDEPVAPLLTLSEPVEMTFV